MLAADLGLRLDAGQLFPCQLGLDLGVNSRRLAIVFHPSERFYVNYRICPVFGGSCIMGARWGKALCTTPEKARSSQATSQRPKWVWRTACSFRTSCAEAKTNPRWDALTAILKGKGHALFLEGQTVPDVGTVVGQRMAYLMQSAAILPSAPYRL